MPPRVKPWASSAAASSTSDQLTDEKLVEAQTQFKLDPGMARKFGASAIASVEKAEGVLADASVAGEDVGTGILASHQRSAGSEAEIMRLEERLKSGDFDKRERAELLAQISQLRGQIGDERHARRSDEVRIAWTSVAFNYVSDGGLPGIGHENPFADAGETLMRSGSTALSFIPTLGAALLPWGVLLGLIVVFWRSRFIGRRPPANGEARHTRNASASKLTQTRGRLQESTPRYGKAMTRQRDRKSDDQSGNGRRYLRSLHRSAAALCPRAVRSRRKTSLKNSAAFLTISSAKCVKWACSASRCPRNMAARE